MTIIATRPTATRNRQRVAARDGTNGVLGWAVLLGVLATCGLGCSNQRPYPARPVTIICPWAAGGGTDRIARFWADALQRELGAPFLVANKTGGAGAIGHRAGAEARPDGYTLTMITFELCTMRHMGVSTLSFKDYDCLMQVNADPAAIVVRKDAPWKSLREFLDDVRRRPGQIKMSGTARGGAWDLARAGLLLADGQPVDAILWIPTQGSAPSLVELLGGHIDAVCCSIPETAASASELRVLAVMADERLAAYPDVPTAKEQGVDWSAVGWRGLACPRNTPPQVTATLMEACRRIADSPEYRRFMTQSGFNITIRDRDDFTAFLEQQDAQWKEVVQRAGFGVAE